MESDHISIFSFACECLLALSFYLNRPKSSLSHCAWLIIFHPKNSLSQRFRKSSTALSLLSLILIDLTFTANTRHTTYIVANYPPSLRLPSMRSKPHSNKIFPRKSALWNRLPTGCSSLRLTVTFLSYPPYKQAPNVTAYPEVTRGFVQADTYCILKLWSQHKRSC